jgi:predicted GNAT superfamily acetyltransferase
MPATVEIHPLVTMEMLRACERLQLQVWGYDELEVVPAAQMRAALHAGALVAGAFVGRELVGFAYGFPALPHETDLTGPGLHSHMAAVVPEARGLGAGRRLKWYQRRWCVEHGMNWVTWTFDPLQARNARLNLHHLGAVVHEYQVDFYGVLGGVLSGDLPTDRFVALWDLTSPHVRAAAARDPAAAAYLLPDDAVVAASAAYLPTDDAVAVASVAYLPTDDAVAVASAPAAARAEDAAWALRRDDDEDAPAEPVVGLQAAAVWTAVPRDVNALRRVAPPRALAWAEASRTVALDLIARGYEVDAFVDGAYRWRPRSASKI